MKKVLNLANVATRFAMTSPVSVASNERSFSKMKLVKNLLRSTMGDDRLEWLMILACEKDVVDSLDVSQIVSTWAKTKKRRVTLA